MAKIKTKYYVILWFGVLVVYALIAAGPVPKETVLDMQWIKSLESSYPVESSFFEGGAASLIPIETENRFGYVDVNGNFSILEQKKYNVSYSKDRWASYENIPKNIDVYSSLNKKLLTVENVNGYPFFLDNKLFFISYQQNSIRSCDDDGNIKWQYDFPAPITCIDSNNGFVIAGLLDGSIELLDAGGKRVFFFEPGGSRIAVIAGLALSKDANRFAIVSGIDDQRFLLLEKFQDSYRVIYHEFLGDGFRKNVFVNFINNEKMLAFEREGALGLYDISARTSTVLPVSGSIEAIEECDESMLFVVSAGENIEKRIMAIKYPGQFIIDAPFKAKRSFIKYEDSILLLGGDSTFAAFKIDTR
jgi:hypothetical protein